MSINLNRIRGHHISADETGNSTKVLLTGSATYTGQWEDVTDYTTVAVAIKGDNVTDGTLYIESSQDGGTTVNSVPFTVADASFDLPHLWNVVETHIRIKYTNGTTAQTGHFQLQTKYSNGQELGLLQNADGTISANTAVQVVKSIGTGTKPDGTTYANSNESGVVPANSSNATLGVSGSFVGTWSVLEGYHGITVLVEGNAGTGDVADGTLYMEFSHDGISTHRSINIPISDITSVAPRTLGTVAKYFRVRYINGTTATTSFDIQTMFHIQQVQLVSRLDGTLNGTEDVSNVRSVQVGQSPDDTFNNVPTSGASTVNSSNATLGVSGSFVGAWENISGQHGITVLVDGTSGGVSDGTLYMEFSHDTVTTHRSISIPVEDVTNAPPRTLGTVAKYFRVRYINGTTATTSFDIQTMFHTQQVHLVSRLGSGLTDNSDVADVRAVTAGQAPDGTFINGRVSGIVFTTTTNLTASETFNSGVLSSVNYQQVQTHILSSHDGTIDIKFYSDSGGTDQLRNLVLPYYASDGFQLFSAPAFSDYVSYEFTNDAGVTTTDFLYETKLLTNALSGQVLSVNAPISSKMVANLGRNIVVSKQPDGTFRNDPHNGVALNTSASLGIGSVYQSPWTDTDGYNSIELFIKTDEVSSVDGIEIHFTDNLDTPTEQQSLCFTFTEIDIARGYLEIIIPPKLVGFRVEYTNGGISQGSFLLQVDLKTNGDNNIYNSGGAVVRADFATEVGLDRVPNYIAVELVGIVRLLDSGDGANTVWNYADDDLSGGVNRKTFKTSPAQIWIASSSGSDTGIDITFNYNDDNNIMQTTTVTLNGQSSVDTGVSGLDCNNAYVSSDDTLAGNVYIQQLDDFSGGGLPNVTSNVLAYINPEHGKTQQATFRVPSDKKMIIRNVFSSLTRASGSATSADFNLRIKPNGQGWTIIRPHVMTNQTPINKTESIVLEPDTLVEYFIDNISDNDTTVSCVISGVLVTL